MFLHKTKNRLLRQLTDTTVKAKKRVSYLYRTAQPSTLAAFPPWGIEQELVVQDLPAAKIEKE